MGDTEQTESRAKVLYVAGYSRSGSTILANVLGEIDGFFSAGEVMYVGDQLISPDATCGCRAHVSTCPLWGAVLDRAFGETMGSADWDEMIRLRNSEWQTRKVPEWLLVAPARRRLARKMAPYTAVLDKLYGAIDAELDGQVIVDSSKNPAYLYFLSLVPGIEIHVVHIVRDPRASAFSWRATKQGFTSHGVWESARSWSARNAMLAMLGSRFGDRYTRIRYEEFVSDPQATLSTLSRFVGADEATYPFLDGTEVTLGTNHCVYGNTDLFKTGKVRLELDERWKQSMDSNDRRVVTTLTWPLLRRFGYRTRD